MGVYIKGVTVEMLRNAPLEAVEDLLASGDMVEVTETHGRLIDADNLEKSLIDDNRQAFTKHQVWLMFSEYNKNVPTVIESEE